MAVGLMAASTTVLAQSNVTLGGQIKGGLDRISVNGGSGANPSATRVTNNTSFWYLDGREDLGGGAQAYYRLEWDFGIDTGALAAGRNFFVGLGNKDLGRLQLGRQSVYFSHHWFVIDSHGSFDAAPNAANSLNVLGTINGAFFSGGFLNNTIRYEAPTIGGFSGMASYTFDAESADNKRNKTWYVNPMYTNGPFRAGYFHMARRAQGALPGQTVGPLDQNADRIALGYLDQTWRVGLIADRNKVTDTTSGVSQHRLAFAIPVGYTFGQHLVSATYGQAQSTKVNGAALQNSGARMLSASYQYTLSKRTQLDVSVIELRNQGSGRYNLWNGSLTGGLQMAVADAGARTRMLYAGIKHNF
nr:porin [Xylophilus sp. ASV27]